MKYSAGTRFHQRAIFFDKPERVCDQIETVLPSVRETIQEQRELQRFGTNISGVVLLSPAPALTHG